MRVRMPWGSNMKRYGTALIAALFFACAAGSADAKNPKSQKCVVTIEYDSGHFAPLTVQGAAYFCKLTLMPGPKWRADPLSDGSEGIAFYDSLSDMVVEIDKD